MPPVSVHLAPVEPDHGPWRLEDAGEVVDRLLARRRPGRLGPAIVAVDGRSGAGKTTLAAVLQSVRPGSVLLHTDDLAWHEPLFGWTHLLMGLVLAPLARGEDVDVRPPQWVARGRDGSVRAASSADVVWVEGVGASCWQVAPHLDASIWVQSDAVVARRLGLARDVALGRTESEAQAFWDEWGAAEDPFLADDRPWERADVVVLGSSDAATVPGRVRVGRWPTARRA